MKKFLFAALLFVGLAATAPVAEAGQFARVYNGRGVVYVHKSQLYSPYQSNHYGHRRHHRYSHSYVSSGYYRPTYYRSYPSYYRTGYDHSYGCYPSRPRVAISFGF